MVQEDNFMTIKKRPIILDGDPGHDDAIAFVLAAAFSDELEIKAITAVGGNQTLQKTTLNYRKIATLLNLKNIPIAAGRDNPLQADLVIAPNYHGESGLDGPKLPEPEVELCGLTAVELMAKVLRESEDKVTIVATGPQTNVASLLLAHPELKDKIQLGYMADSTYTNALETSQWIKENQLNNIILVTSFYHMPRSLLEMHHRLPNLEVTPYSIFPRQIGESTHWIYTNYAWQLLLEYNKFLITYSKYFIQRIIK